MYILIYMQIVLIHNLIYIYTHTYCLNICINTECILLYVCCMFFPPESYTLSDPRGMMSSELSVVSGTLSEQTNPEEMEVLQSSEHLILSDTPGSGTESSSFGSNCSSHALLTQGEGEDQRKMAV